jgi:osmotically-inducible protein OsmY
MAPPTVSGGGAPILGAPPSRFQLQLQDALQQSSRLSAESKAGITVAMDGPVVVLRGTVATPAEAQLAANLLALTPGVREIRNELTLR